MRLLSKYSSPNPLNKVRFTTLIIERISKVTLDTTFPREKKKRIGRAGCAKAAAHGRPLPTFSSLLLQLNFSRAPHWNFQNEKSKAWATGKCRGKRFLETRDLCVHLKLNAFFEAMTYLPSVSRHAGERGKTSKKVNDIVFFAWSLGKFLLFMWVVCIRVMNHYPIRPIVRLTQWDAGYHYQFHLITLAPSHEQAKPLPLTTHTRHTRVGAKKQTCSLRTEDDVQMGIFNQFHSFQSFIRPIPQISDVFHTKNI